MFIRKLKLKALKNDQGFTLVEIMVALGILSFGVLAVASMQSTSLLGSARSNSITQASTVAMDRMERLMALPFTTWNPAAQNGDDTFFSSDPPPTPPRNIQSVTWSVAPGPAPLQDSSRLISVTAQAKDMGVPVTLTSLKIDI